MKHRLAFFVVTAVISFCGCATSGRIARERQAFLQDPSSPAYGYDGKPIDSGTNCLFLYKHDPEFGEYLLTVVATATDPRIPCVALEYFTYRKPDPEKFQQVVDLMNPSLREKEVNTSVSDSMTFVRLSEYIEELRRKVIQPSHGTPAKAVPSSIVPEARRL